MNHIQTLIRNAQELFMQRKFHLAKICLHEVISKESKNSVANELLAYIYGNDGDLQSAAKFLEVAISSQDASINALYEYGSLLLENQKPMDAIPILRRALSLKSDSFEILHDLGSALALTGNKNEALEKFEQALKFGKNRPELYYNLARIYDDEENYFMAIGYYQKAIELDPQFFNAWLNLGLDFNQIGNYEKGMHCFERALFINPNHDFLYGDLIFSKMRLCQWDEYQDELLNIQNGIETGKNLIIPFPILALFDSPQLQLQAAKNYVKTKYSDALPRPIKHLGVKKSKIRIAYFSADFRKHPLSYLISELFETHNRNDFELIGIVFGPRAEDEMTERIKKSFDRLVDIRDLSDHEAARVAGEMELDIAIDLGGYVDFSRTGIFAYRVAPVQVSYLGYLGTMGAEFIDYIIADQITIPLENRQYYTEKIAYLPNYQVNDLKKKISEKVFSRAELGISEDAFVYCCFNSNYKITPHMYGLWMKILKAVEKGILLIYAENNKVKENLRRAAMAHEVDLKKIIFVGRLSHAEYLSRYKVADLFLDTFPYNAGATASDAIWAGIPILTRQGKSFASRVGSSVSRAAGLNGLIAYSDEEYEALAIDWGCNLEKINQIKKSLLNSRQSPLFDINGFTLAIENIYKQMHDRSIQGLPPEHLVA